jgi:predicted 2-oxoglutarate/Fe(II)-dependent dioxygenase YbiX
MAKRTFKHFTPRDKPKKRPRRHKKNLNKHAKRDLKYSAGGKYEIHTDAYSWSPRSLSIIINLNDEYKGGDLIFTDQKEKEIKRFKLSAGSIVFFPSNFMYPHSIQPITKGKRYSIVAWLQ